MKKISLFVIFTLMLLDIPLEAKNSKKVENWINLSEKKPPIRQYKLFCAIDYDIFVGIYLKNEDGEGFIYVNDQRKYSLWFVLYWMNLPELPEDERFNLS